jgi:hypothetical protein
MLESAETGNLIWRDHLRWNLTPQAFKCLFEVQISVWPLFHEASGTFIYLLLPRLSLKGNCTEFSEIEDAGEG